MLSSRSRSSYEMIGASCDYNPHDYVFNNHKEVRRDASVLLITRFCTLVYGWHNFGHETETVGYDLTFIPIVLVYLEFFKIELHSVVQPHFFGIYSFFLMICCCRQFLVLVMSLPKAFEVGGSDINTKLCRFAEAIFPDKRLQTRIVGFV
jgi:hypothetical protein